MYPSTVKMTKPDRKLVRQLTELVTKASLSGSGPNKVKKIKFILKVTLKVTNENTILNYTFLDVNFFHLHGQQCCLVFVQ